MSLIDITFLALALAMDCFTVSIVSGVIIRKYILSIILRMAILFGLFQAMMPFIGWLGTSYFSHYLESVDHWIAFGLLAFLGGKMIKDSFGSEEEAHFDPSKLTSQLLFAVATSIDALAVGISFACLGYKNIEQLTLPLIVIGVCSFVMFYTWQCPWCCVWQVYCQASEARIYWRSDSSSDRFQNIIRTHQLLT